MPPVSSLAGILDSPVVSSNGSTVMSGTLPDITLGSLGSSFHSAEEGEYDEHELAPRRSRSEYAPSSFATPGHAPAAALLQSPPTTAARPTSKARRSRLVRSGHSSGSDNEALDVGYGAMSDDDDLASLTLAQSQKRDVRSSQKRAGRHSAAPGASNQMTLREQEQNVDTLQKENFNLQLENHFLKERLASMAPDHIESALKENVRLKIEILNLGKELKKCKKLLLQQDRDLASAARGGGRGRDGDSRELETMWREEKARREALEDELEQLRDEHSDKLRALEDDLDTVRGQLDDHVEENGKLRDAADRAEDELERVRDEARGLTESVGVSKGRENRLAQRLEQENAELLAEVEELRKGGGADIDMLEEQMNALRDQFAAAQIDLDRRDEEIEELNNEIDAKVQEHEKEIQQVEAGWRDEVLEGRARIDELQDVLQEREAEVEEIRKALLEREDEVMAARERIAELEAVQGFTHDRLEETLRNIEMDNADKEADLVSANREVETLGQRVFELEEIIEDLRSREGALGEELQRTDEEKEQYEVIVAALKEARKKAQDEREEYSARLKRSEDERIQDAEHHRRALASRDQANERLAAELEAARDRVTMRDRDLVNVQNALRDLEEEKQKLGHARSSDQRSLELEIERYKRDLTRCEDELDRARDELREREQALHDRDLEVADLIDKQRQLETNLATERQGRLNVSDKLDTVQKTAGKHEREAETLRKKVEELEPLLTATRSERMQTQKQSEQQRQERTELLLRVFKDVNRFLGTEDNTTPANFGVFRDTLLQRLRSIQGARADFDKRIKETEVAMEKKMASLKRQVDTKWRALDGFEASIKKAQLAHSTFRTRLAQKEGELDGLRARVAELQREVGSGRPSGASPSGELRAATDRAATAERRYKAMSERVDELQAQLDQAQRRHDDARSKWEARVKEYEERLRVAGEKYKAERQGGKERTRQLEDQVRAFKAQLEVTNAANRRAEGVVANARHLLDA